MLVHEVIAAITTEPWSTDVMVPSSSVTSAAAVGRPAAWPARFAERVRAAAVLAVGGERVRGREGVGDVVVQPVQLHVGAERRAERGLSVGQRDPVLRPLRPGQRRHDRGQVELDVLGVPGARARVKPETLLLGVRLDQRDLLRRAAGEPQVGQRLAVDREDRAGRAELRAHVADRGPVGDRNRGHAVAVELDELADDAVLAEQLGNGQHQVGGGRAGWQLASELEADYARDQHRNGLAQHRGLGLDAADAPAQDAEAVLHGGVGVGADAGVRVGGQAAVRRRRHHHAGQVLDVDLVHDAGAGRHDLELPERLLAPAQEREPLVVALELELHVAVEGVRPAEDVGDYRVVDDELGRHERVDLPGVAAQRPHRLAHRSQVHHRGHAGQVLHQHPGRAELDLRVRLGGRVPAGQRADMLRGDIQPVLGAQQVLQQDLEAVGQVTGAVDGIQPVYLIARPADGEIGPAAEAVPGHGS